MVKSEIIKGLEERCYRSNDGNKLTAPQVKVIVDKLFGFLVKSISSGKRIEVRGFGSFTLKRRAASVLRNPRHGIMFEASERHVVYFRAGIKLAKKVNQINAAE